MKHAQVLVLAIVSIAGFGCTAAHSRPTVPAPTTAQANESGTIVCRQVGIDEGQPVCVGTDGHTFTDLVKGQCPKGTHLKSVVCTEAPAQLQAPAQPEQVAYAEPPPPPPTTVAGGYCATHWSGNPNHPCYRPLYVRNRGFVGSGWGYPASGFSVGYTGDGWSFGLGIPFYGGVYYGFGGHRSYHDHDHHDDHHGHNDYKRHGGGGKNHGNRNPQIRRFGIVPRGGGGGGQGNVRNTGGGGGRHSGNNRRGGRRH